jgi:hypothetical protein
LANSASVSFLIFKNETGGEPLFAETQTVALDPAGHYKVQLGATLANGLPQDLFSTGEARWLEVQIAGQSPQARVLLVSVPYALKAGDATTLGGLPVSAFALAGSAKTATAANQLNGANPDIVSNVTTTGGTVGYVPEFSGASAIVDSPIFVNGGNVGIGTATPIAPLTVAGNAAVTGTLTATGNTLLNGGLAITGNSFYSGPVNMLATGTATASAGFNSQPFKFLASGYNSTTHAAVSSHFLWQSEVLGNNSAAPSATLNLLSSTTSAAPTETGFHFNANGTIKFAPGQTFPGIGTITGVTAGTALTGGGTTGTVTLNLDTTKVPLLASANHFTASQSVTGNISATGQLVSTVTTGTAPLAVSSTTQVPKLNASLLGGLAPSALAALAVSNNFSATQSFTKIGIGTTTPRSLLEGQATASKALGPVFTLTNTAGGLGAESAVDFNTLMPSTSGTYNPAVRIVAQDINNFSDDLLFQFNIPGAQNHGLQTNMAITPAGQVGIGTTTPRSVLEVTSSGSSTQGPSLTLSNTNTPTPVASATASIDFNTFKPHSFGTYNPSSRIAVFSDGNYSDSFEFLVNDDGGANKGMYSVFSISNDGRFGNYGLGNLSSAVLTITPNNSAGIITTGGNDLGSDANGNPGIISTGAVGGENVSGDGGDFYGGSSDGVPPGNGIFAVQGGCQDGFTCEGGAYAGNFQGDINVTGAITAGAKDFKIDDPVDPANKYLYHASVESSEMMNIYSGNVTTDELGLATVKLPGWFEAENTDFRYQLTTIGRDAHAWIAKKVQNGGFQIATNATNVEVSWQITAVRQDAFAKAHPLVVEREKPVRERGFYQNPELYGQPAEKQTEWGRRPQQMQHVKDMREQQRTKALERRNAAHPANQAQPLTISQLHPQ